MTQQNAALVEESAAAASALSDQARKLGEVVSLFKVNGGVVTSAVAMPKPVKAPMHTAPAARTTPKVSAPAAAPKVEPVAQAPAPAKAAPKAPVAAPAPAPTRPAKAAVVDDQDWETF